MALSLRDGPESEAVVSRPMRILLLTQFFDPEPAAIPGMPLASWLLDRGHEVEVVTGFPNYPGGKVYPGYPVRLFRREDYAGVRVNRVPLFPSHDRSALNRLANYASFGLAAATVGTLVTRRPDVVYVYHPPATVGLPAMLWKTLRRTPFLFHVQDLWPESVMGSGMVDVGLRRKVEAAIEWWCQRIYDSAGAIAVLSPGFKRILVDRGVPAEKIHVVANWAQEDTFFPRPQAPALASELGFAGQFNVVYAGNMGFYQNLDVAVRAARRVRHLPNFRLVFIGVGQAEAELRRLATELGADNVRFLGRRPFREMGPITNLADALLVSLQDLPFFAATVPGKTQVALAAGRPVIMAVRGDAALMVQDSAAGVTVPPGDEQALAAAFEHFYNSPATELARMGKQGRDYYTRTLSLERGASRLEDLLTMVASD